MIFSSLRRIYAKEPVMFNVSAISRRPFVSDAACHPVKRAYFSLYRVKIEPFSSCRLIVFHICKPFLLTCQYSSFSSRCQDRTPRSMIYLIYTFLGNSAYYRNSEFNGNSVFNGNSAFCSVSGGASRKYLISGRMPPEMKNT